MVPGTGIHQPVGALTKLTLHSSACRRGNGPQRSGKTKNKLTHTNNDVLGIGWMALNDVAILSSFTGCDRSSS